MSAGRQPAKGEVEQELDGLSKASDLLLTDWLTDWLGDRQKELGK